MNVSAAVAAAAAKCTNGVRSMVAAKARSRRLDFAATQVARTCRGLSFRWRDSSCGEPEAYCWSLHTSGRKTESVVRVR